MVDRYGPKGSGAGDFWDAQNCDPATRRCTGPGGDESFPYMPITSWELWNEPNLPAFWGASAEDCALEPPGQGYCGPEPTKYGAALVYGKQGLRYGNASLGQTGDPNSRAVFGGVTTSGASTCGTTFCRPWTFWQRTQQWSGTCPAADAVAFHAYQTVAQMETNPTGFASVVTSFRNTMNNTMVSGYAPGGNVPIWVNEFGWDVDLPFGGDYTTNATNQATLINSAASYIKNNRSAKQLGVTDYFALRDAPMDRRLENTGLISRSGDFRPSWSTYKDSFAGLGGTLALPTVRSNCL